MDPKRTGAYLAALRKNRGMTQQDAAERLGVSNKTVSKWESGGGFPDISVLPALAELYGVTADGILAGGEEPPGEAGPSQVEQYLTQRGDLRFRLGLAASALCLAGARLYLGINFSILLLLASVLAVWAGFAACPAAGLKSRLGWLLPVAAGQTWVAVWFVWTLWLAPAFKVSAVLPKENYFWVWGYLRSLAVWTGAVLLVPLVYAGFRAVLRRRGGGTLLDRRFFRIVAAGWGALVCWLGARWLWEWPLAIAYASVNTQHPKKLERTWNAYWQAAEPLGWVPWAVLLAAALALAWPRLCKK